MGLIALIAVELASMRVGSEGYVDVSRYLTVGMLAVATCLARYRRGDRAAWWFGFAILGWAYFALAVDATARQGAALGRRTFPFAAAPLPPVTLVGIFVEDPTNNAGPALSELLWHRYEILQSTLTLVVACLGGLAGWLLARRRGAPYREEERHAGRLELGDEPEDPAAPPLRPS